ncbi:MAG TPA: hypothetical protein PLB32_19750, partial [Acidobacteriota bacterium]|nr:hypothetical protein [Acidobacteriota bacterium]
LYFPSPSVFLQNSGLPGVSQRVLSGVSGLFAGCCHFFLRKWHTIDSRLSRADALGTEGLTIVFPTRKKVLYVWCET